MKVAVALALVLVLGAPAALAQTALSPGGKPPILREVGIDQRLGADLPLDAEFRDESGRPVKLGEYFRGERPVVLALVYYKCPQLCNEILNGLTASLRTMSLEPGTDIDVVAVSFDPREGPDLAHAKRAAYVRRYRGRELPDDAAEQARAAAGWHFLVGDDAAIRALTAAVGFRYAFDKTRGEYAHASAVFAITPRGKIARYHFGVLYPPRDLRLSLVEASEGRVGTAADRVILYCFQYDPATGKYGAIVSRVLKIGAGATLAALVGFWIFSWRWNRRKEARAACPA